MCRNLQQELRDLDIQAAGTLTDAEAQRRVHQTLYQAVRDTSRGSDYTAYETALARWNGHIAEHQRQARSIRAEREK